MSWLEAENRNVKRLESSWLGYLQIPSWVIGFCLRFRWSWDHRLNDLRWSYNITWDIWLLRVDEKLLELFWVETTGHLPLLYIGLMYHLTQVIYNNTELWCRLLLFFKSNCLLFSCNSLRAVCNAFLCLLILLLRLFGLLASTWVQNDLFFAWLIWHRGFCEWLANLLWIVVVQRNSAFDSCRLLLRCHFSLMLIFCLNDLWTNINTCFHTKLIVCYWLQDNRADVFYVRVWKEFEGRNHGH